MLYLKKAGWFGNKEARLTGLTSVYFGQDTFSAVCWWGEKEATKSWIITNSLTLLIFVCLFFGAKCVKLCSDRTKPRRKSDESTTITLKEMEIISLQLPLCTWFSLYRLFVMLMDFEVCTGQSVTIHWVIHLFPGIEQLSLSMEETAFRFVEADFFLCHNFH